MAEPVHTDDLLVRLGGPDAWGPFLTERVLGAGDVLFRQGTTGREVYFIAEGQLAAVLEIDGGRSVRLRELGQGSVLGEIAVYLATARTATVVADMPTRVWELAPPSLERMEREAPALAIGFHRAIMRQVAERLAQLTRELRGPLALLAGFVQALEESHLAVRSADAQRAAGDPAGERTPIATARVQLQGLAAARRDELGQLAQAFLGMEANLLRYVDDLRRETSARERVEREMEIAGEIQASFLRGDFTMPPFDRGVDIHARLLPAKQAAGDLYDFRFVGDRHLFFLVGDVSDKGMPAALFMAVAITLARSLSAELRPASDFLARLNDGLCQINLKEQFLTACAGFLDLRTGEVRLANGGHLPPLLRGSDGVWRPVTAPAGVVLGMFPGSRYEESRFILPRGAQMLIYTDGVNEAFDAAGAMFGDERLVQTLQTLPPEAPSETATRRVVESVQAFVQGAPRSDDISLLALRRV